MSDSAAAVVGQLTIPVNTNLNTPYSTRHSTAACTHNRLGFVVASHLPSCIVHRWGSVTRPLLSSARRLLNTSHLIICHVDTSTQNHRFSAACHRPSVRPTPLPNKHRIVQDVHVFDNWALYDTVSLVLLEQWSWAYRAQHSTAAGNRCCALAGYTAASEYARAAQ